MRANGIYPRPCISSFLPYERHGGRRDSSHAHATKIGIDRPAFGNMIPGMQMQAIVSMNNRSLATSGNYRKFRIDSLTGEKFVHTINPHTGFTENSNILATSVLAETCMEADGYATAFMAMRLEDSKKLLLESPELEGYIIYLGEEGETREYMTPGFEALVQ